MEAKQTAEMQIAPVQDVECTWLENDMIQHQYIVHTSVGNVDEGRNTTAQIQQGMHFNGATRMLVGSPWTKRKTDINRGRVQRVHRIAKLHTEWIISISGRAMPIKICAKSAYTRQSRCSLASARVERATWPR